MPTTGEWTDEMQYVYTAVNRYGYCNSDEHWKTNWKKLNTKDDTWFHFYALLKMSEFYAM